MITVGGLNYDWVAKILNLKYNSIICDSLIHMKLTH